MNGARLHRIALETRRERPETSRKNVHGAKPACELSRWDDGLTKACSVSVCPWGLVPQCGLSFFFNTTATTPRHEVTTPTGGQAPSGISEQVPGVQHVCAKRSFHSSLRALGPMLWSSYGKRLPIHTEVLPVPRLDLARAGHHATVGLAAFLCPFCAYVPMLLFSLYATSLAARPPFSTSFWVLSLFSLRRRVSVPI